MRRVRRNATGTKSSPRKFHVLITAIFPVEVPATVAAKEEARGTLDHEIWERFERQHGDRIGLETIRETRFLTENLGCEWEPIYRLPPSYRKNKPLDGQEMRRAARAFMSGGAEDVYTPDPSGVLAI
jgi:hypothetical protein